jgi:hypothetical protein
MNTTNEQLDSHFLEPSIIHVILLNRTLRILCSLGIFCALIPLADYFYFYSTQIVEHQTDDSGICSHYPIYQIPCGVEVSINFIEIFNSPLRCYSLAVFTFAIFYIFFLLRMMMLILLNVVL